MLNQEMLSIVDYCEANHLSLVRVRLDAQDFIAEREDGTPSTYYMSDVTPGIKKVTETVGNYAVFADRVQSLLERWNKFCALHKTMPNIEESCIKNCLVEINEGFTKSLMKEG